MADLVSIIIPCYRQGRWLSQAIESCLGQTHRLLEVIVVNDGSDDDTAKVCECYADRIRYLHQANAGLSAARNFGFAASRGSFILALDADDALHPEAVTRLMTAASTTPPRIAMMGWKSFQNDVSEPAAEILPTTIDLIPSLLRNNPGPPHTFLSPRSTLTTVGGWDKALRGVADWDCWFRQLFAGADLAGVPFVGAYYRQSPGQMSRDELAMTADLRLASDKLYQLAKTHPDRLRSWHLDPEATVREFRNRAAREHAHLAYLYRQRGERGRAARHYLNSVALGHWRGLRGLIALPLSGGTA